MNPSHHVTALLTFAALMLPVQALSAADNLQCMKIQDSAGKARYTADLAPKDLAFAAAAGCTIQVPAKQLCVEVTKSNVMPAPPGAPAGEEAQRYLCYKTKCPKTAGITTSEFDQFGTRDVLSKQVGLVCVPVHPGPTCSDGIQNGDETGVDCGGSACDSCGTCSDGIKNGSETDVDCGGPLGPSACPRCGPFQDCLDSSDCAGFPVYYCSELYGQCELNF